MSPRGVRNNNPGNIRGSSIAWRGQTGVDAAGFCIFDTPFNGIRALALLLLSYQDKYGLNTVRGIINRWAPPVENNTSAYVAAVAAAAGVTQDAPVNVHSLDMLRKLTTAIIQHENGPTPGGWYQSALIGSAIADALGVVPKDEPRKTMATDLKSTFGTIIAQLIPQAAKILLGGSPYAALADTVLQTVVQATGAANEQDAVEKMQADPALLKAATQAVVTQPDVMAVLEVGGGIKAAAERDAASTQAPKGFWHSPAFWITLILLAMPFMLLADVFYVHPDAYKGDIRTQVITAVLAIIMVSCGFWLGSSQGSQKKDDALIAKGTQ